MQRKKSIELHLRVGQSGSKARDEGGVCTSPVLLRAILTPRLLRFPSHSSALPFIELLSKDAVGLMSQDLHAFPWGSGGGGE